ncbi:RidA family protein [Nocardiopsis sp. CNT312]|uniref:RidA family protein n=1 Tax=Nocardiopsis sp. CNT312 TaxID=1137268 RepID=UPI00048ED05D|nr:RidA family protein [Nocardiopsis sp. CNT312]
MAVRLLSPEGMAHPVPYHHVAVGTGTRQVHVSGQVGGADGGLAAQTAQALRNTARGLAGAGAGMADVVRLTFYVVGWRPEQMAAFMDGVERAAGELGMPRPMPPASLIGVESLFEPGVLVEVEATAVLD